MKSASWSVCLSSLKNTSISHLALYSSQTVLAAHFVLFVRESKKGPYKGCNPG